MLDILEEYVFKSIFIDNNYKQQVNLNKDKKKNLSLSAIAHILCRILM